MKGTVFDRVGRRVGRFVSDAKGIRVIAVDQDLQRRLDLAMEKEWPAPIQPEIRGGALVDRVAFGKPSAPNGGGFFTSMLIGLGLRAGDLELGE